MYAKIVLRLEEEKNGENRPIDVDIFEGKHISYKICILDREKEEVYDRSVIMIGNIYPHKKNDENTIKILVLKVDDQTIISTCCKLFIMNNEGKTIDSLTCP